MRAAATRDRSHVQSAKKKKNFNYFSCMIIYDQYYPYIIDPRLLLLVQELWQMHQRRMFALLK
jgi:hypothetical protein